MRRTIAAAAGLLLAAPVLTATGTAGAAPAVTAKACYLQAGAWTTGKDYVDRYVNATAPITVKPTSTMAKNPYGARAVGLSSEWVWDDDFGDETLLTGYIVSGGALFSVGISTTKGTGGAVKSTDLTRIGGGWDQFHTLTRSRSADGPERTYALRNDGTLFRWNVGLTNGKPVWRAAGSAPGFAAVKSVALLSRTSTYDTLLATTRSGALYTIHLPLTSPLKPVVKQVRSGTWQGFETLLTSRCGNYGTLLLGVDKDTGAGNLYAVGHANGTSTVIKSLGKVPATFNEPVTFAWQSYVDDQVFGE
ncbi:hypothetical protein AB0E69_20340 [Kribbella sp. NPDC026611]|uniref:hypothetical protein n=1 Tax=Kribbella sp. NPDC026611 TaxID=3154911 RepID=UPI003406FBE7